MTTPQFGQLLGGEGKRAGDAPSSRALSRWEAGFARVPMRMYLRAEELHAQLMREQESQQEGGEAGLMVAQEYPRQESMVGPEYQASVPKPTPAAKWASRKDECVWSPRLAQREAQHWEGLTLQQYLEKVRAALQADEELQYDEEVALDVLHELGYNAQAALRALTTCMAWRGASAEGFAAVRSSCADGGRTPLVNSILWLQRLQQAGRRRNWSAGECEALEAGLRRNGKDLAFIHDEAFKDKTVYEVIEMYYTTDMWQRLKAAPDGSSSAP